MGNEYRVSSYTDWGINPSYYDKIESDSTSQIEHDLSRSLKNML